MPLSGYCAFGCIDNGTNSPSARNPPEYFGFTADLGALPTNGFNNPSGQADGLGDLNPPRIGDYINAFLPADPTPTWVKTGMTVRWVDANYSVVDLGSVAGSHWLVLECLTQPTWPIPETAPFSPISYVSGMTGAPFIYVILVPNSEIVFSVDLFGTHTATASQVGMWTTGGLAAVLGITAQPFLPIQAFLPSTQAIDPGATGFTVFMATIPGIELEGISRPNISPVQLLGGPLPRGSYILGFLNVGTEYIATSTGGAIFITFPAAIKPKVSATFIA